MIDCLLAPNPGPMTLDGTNTYLIGDPSQPRAVVDPGPDDPAHLQAIIAAAPAGIAEIWLTHHHADHLAAVPELAAHTGAVVRAWRSAPDLAIEVAQFEQLCDGQEMLAGGQLVVALHLPGHTSDSVGFLVGGSQALLTGDMVLGRGTTVIAHPDGDVGAYLSSLERMRALVEPAGITTLLPGHGPRLTDPSGVLDHYRTHRQQRLDQVRSALAQGAQTAEDVVDQVYADVDSGVRDAAILSVEAQLAYLRG